MNCFDVKEEKININFFIKLFKLLSVSYFESFAEDLGYGGKYNYKIRDIARIFLRRILLLDGEVILPNTHIRDDISEDDLLAVWLETFDELKKAGYAQDVCTWFSIIQNQERYRDNRLDVVPYFWNDFFYNWPMEPDKYPKISLPDATIQSLRIEMLVYRVKIIELTFRVDINTNRYSIDQWDLTSLSDKNIYNWIHDIARSQYAICKWSRFFEIVKYENLDIVEKVWGDHLVKYDNLGISFTLKKLFHYMNDHSLIKK